MWCQDEAGPYQAIPHEGASWQQEGKAQRQPHEYVRGGTAKLLTLFRPATGQLRAKGVKQTTNAVLHPWLKEQLTEILAQLDTFSPSSRPVCAEGDWEGWFESKLLVQLPPIRMILIWDNLAGHKNYELWKWLLAHGVMPLFTPLGGSWLNMAESVQRIIVRRALGGQHPQSAEEVIRWLQETVEGWNRHPTPFVWGGKRQERRKRARERRLRQLGGSGAALPIGYSIAA